MNVSKYLVFLCGLHEECSLTMLQSDSFFRWKEIKNRVVKVWSKTLQPKKVFPLGGKCPGFSVSFGLRSQGYNYGNFALPNKRTKFSLTLKPLLTFIGLN